MINYLNTQMIRAIANAQSRVVCRRGADSLEYIAVAVIIIVAVVVAFGVLGDEIQRQANRIVQSIRGA